VIGAIGDYPDLFLRRSRVRKIAGRRVRRCDECIRCDQRPPEGNFVPHPSTTRCCLRKVTPGKIINSDH
jgi:hypothetical protein